MALSVGATYNDDFGRVQVTFTGAAPDADYARVEHSLDQITWSTIRGGDTVPVSAGAGHIDHYDGYVFGVPNYYRVTAVDAALVQPVSFGAFAAGNNATLNPALPSGLAAGNMMVMFVTHQNLAASIVTPSGWTLVAGGASNMAVFYRAYQTGDSAPSVAFSGGAAGNSCSAQIRAWSNAQAPVHAALLSNASAQDVATPGSTQLIPNLVWIMHEWKQATGTGAGLPTGQFEADPIGGFNTAGANAESQVIWRTKAETNAQIIPSGVTSWTGGSAAVSKARLLYMQARTSTDIASISYTPALPSPDTRPYWLMNPSRPGQNVRVEITGLTEITNDSRAGVMEVLGRSFPVVVSDVMGSDKLSFDIDAANKSQALELAQRLQLGDPMYLLTADTTADIGTFYFSCMSLSRKPDALKGSWTLTVECRVIPKPSPAVYGSTYIWNDVVSNFATWTDVVAGVSTWSNLVDQVSNNVIVVP